jgi:hypothetical protein
MCKKRPEFALRPRVLIFETASSLRDLFLAEAGAEGDQEDKGVADDDGHRVHEKAIGQPEAGA